MIYIWNYGTGNKNWILWTATAYAVVCPIKDAETLASTILLTLPSVFPFLAFLYLQYSSASPLTKDAIHFPLQLSCPPLCGWAKATRDWCLIPNRIDHTASYHTWPSSATPEFFRCPCLECKALLSLVLKVWRYKTLSARKAHSVSIP